MSRLADFIGIPSANDRVMRLAKVLLTLGPLANFTVVMSTTFYLIFVAEALGGGVGYEFYVEGLKYVGTLIAIEMGIQLLLDYPTGAIGDWIGQRYIITSATLCYALSFYMVSFVEVGTPFWYLVIIYAILGFADSQQSGAFSAWFDNNYRAAMPGDVQRKQYGVFLGRLGMVMAIVSTAALIPGSLIAAILGRPFVFQLQAVLMVILAVSGFILIVDFPEVREAREGRPSFEEYKEVLGGGISYLFEHPFIKYIVIGSMLAASSIIVWGNLILFPLYFSYLLTDVAVASFRTILFVPGVFSQERSGVWSQRFEPKKWIPRFRLLQTCGLIFFWVVGIVMAIFPPASPTDPTFDILFPFTNIAIITLPYVSIIPILLLLAAFISTSFFGAFAEILTQRELLDAIPNKIRNSMYSLSPTIATLFALPQIVFFGWSISTIGFPTTLLLCGVVSLLGVILIRHGLSKPKPVVQDHVGFKPSQEEIDESDEGWPDEMLEKEIFDISEDDEIV
jgi:MFS family permease